MGLRRATTFMTKLERRKWDVQSGKDNLTSTKIRLTCSRHIHDFSSSSIGPWSTEIINLLHASKFLRVSFKLKQKGATESVSWWTAFCHNKILEIKVEPTIVYKSLFDLGSVVKLWGRPCWLCKIHLLSHEQKTGFRKEVEHSIIIPVSHVAW